MWRRCPRRGRAHTRRRSSWRSGGGGWLTLHRRPSERGNRFRVYVDCLTCGRNVVTECRSLVLVVGQPVFLEADATLERHDPRDLACRTSQRGCYSNLRRRVRVGLRVRRHRTASLIMLSEGRAMHGCSWCGQETREVNRIDIAVGVGVGGRWAGSG